jgi:hypothetical protein
MVTEIFEAVTSSVLGDGASMFFWLDKWLPEGHLKDLAPHLFALISKRLSRSRLVKDCLDGGWLDDIPVDLLELCPRGNNKDVIIIILVHDNIYIPC